MPVSYSTTLKNDRLQAVLDRLLGKTPGAATGTPTAPVLVIGTSALSGATGVLAALPLDTTPATIANGVLTFTDMPLSANALANGTAAKAELRDNAGTVIVSGLTVGAPGSGADVVLGTVALTTGLSVQINVCAITHL